MKASGLSVLVLGTLAFTGCLFSTEGLGPSESTGGSGASSGSGQNTGAGSSTTQSTSSGPLTCSAGFSCVPEVASATYVLMIDGANQACPASWGAGSNITDGVDPGCPSCACGAPSGGSCSPGTVTRWETAACTGNSNSTAGALTDGQCVDVIAGASGFQLTPWQITQGQCAPAESAKTPFPLATRTACALPAPSPSPCDQGVCVPDAGGANGKVCIELPSSATCPNGWNAAADGYPLNADTRTCACGCGNAQGATCPGAGITLFSSNDCVAGNLLTFQAPSSIKECHDTSALDTNDSYLVEAGTWTPGSCAPTTTHGGSVDLGAPMKICCLP